MKKRLIELLTQVPGDGAWSTAIQRNLNTADQGQMLRELKSASLDNGSYFQKLLGKEAYELLMDMV